MISSHSYPIYKEITLNDYRIIVFNWLKIPDNSPDLNRNVICVDQSDKIIWQIEKFEIYPGPYPKNACYYVGFNYVKEQLILINACDLAVYVDYKTGKVLKKIESRMG